jgi:hypothetical protein
MTSALHWWLRCSRQTKPQHKATTMDKPPIRSQQQSRPQSLKFQFTCANSDQCYELQSAIFKT